MSERGLERDGTFTAGLGTGLQVSRGLQRLAIAKSTVERLQRAIVRRIEEMTHNDSEQDLWGLFRQLWDAVQVRDRLVLEVTELQRRQFTERPTFG